MTHEQILIRREAEGNVRAYHTGIASNRNRANSELSDSQLRLEWINKIRSMDDVTLLRFVHIDDRSRLAISMMKEGMITRSQAREFAKLP
jgi:hypothetical protein